MTWAFLQTGFLRGENNMLIDSFLARHINDNEESPILRLYGWNPPAISIGYNQSLIEFDPDKLQQEGIDLVRRPTGGRAILHWNELTYCVVIPHHRVSLHEIYHQINNALLAGVQLLGINAELTSASNSTRELYFESSSPACFSSSAKSEIQYRNRKLIGSAQRRLGNVVLQHGSLLLGPQHLQISSLMANSSIGQQNEMRQHLIEHAIDAETALQRTVTFEEAAFCIQKGFENTLGIQFIEPSQSLLEGLPVQLEYAK
ncbi:MAG: hypothetical protein EPO24_04175 [Bacteroidetes bacterium]|nr:MAG: hypothetical protein EPO24_04175 [Bacteroidota bacterium]